ncbi:MAG: NAD(P)-dependent glycerol-3-phosphate dehydrogenase [Candidatus Omnitrophica bacterium]|nr:NAD(P)-dependent glycerol-3-phosphate dehydrogenase [Candidatus Omnitrophota bacterium]
MNNRDSKNISVIGDGGWGTTLAVHLAKKGCRLRLWGPFPAALKEMQATRINSRFLPGIRLPENILIEADLAMALTTAQMIVFAIPSRFAHAVLRKMAATKVEFSKKIFISVTKGIDTKNLLPISRLIEKELGPARIVVLSGPNIAGEVVREIPSTAVAASRQSSAAQTVQAVFNSEYFRVYTNTDVIGVELGGSLKNVMALACGVCDGLGFGTNTKAALMTRALPEMIRLGKAFGAKSNTFSGLSGLGDLITTAFNPQSRNRTVGEQLGQGRKIQDILSSMKMVAEGVETVKAVYPLSQKLKIDMPITTEMYRIIYRKKSPLAAVAALMTRKMKAE